MNSWFWRDAWNILIRHLPSRRARAFWLKRMMPMREATAFVGLGVFVSDPHQIALGSRSVINMGCILDGRGGGLTIENDVDIGPYTHIWTLEHDPNDEAHGTRPGPVVIRHHVWIAARVTILPGITIGEGAVIGAGSVVTKDVAPLSIVAGSPARVVGQRTNTLSYEINYRPRFR